MQGDYYYCTVGEMVVGFNINEFYYYLRKQGGGYVIVPSFCHSVNRITDERGNRHRLNLAGMDKE